jgi:hypothetical protein
MTPDYGPWIAVVVSLGSVALFTAHVLDAGRRYRCHRDTRAALDLLVALTLAAAATGLLAASLAPFLAGLGLARGDDVRDAGFGVVSGALLVTSGTMFLIDRSASRASGRAP